MVNEHCLQHLVEQLSTIYGFSPWLSFVFGLPAPIRPAARSRKMEVGLETYFIHSTHPVDEESIIFREASCGSVPETGRRSSE
jgi:hypothetical protein